jgi:HlyD family secretion protein
MKRGIYNYLIVLLLSVFFGYSCQHKNGNADAYGVFEATEITVSSENNGKILFFDAEEGKIYQKGDLLGCIDTMQLYLQMMQLESNMNAVSDKVKGIPGGKEKIKNELESLRYQKMQIEKSFQSCFLRAPITGTLTKKYLEPFELAYQGKPLYKLANLSQMYIRVYVTEDQLSQIKLGQNAEIHIDRADGDTKSLKGNISWISSKAEFTPKMIQTKKERVNLVYAVNVVFHNDGSAKIGMPGDVIFK